MQILIPTSDKTINALRGFAYFWKLYAGDLADFPITVAGYMPPFFDLPQNYNFISLGKFEDYPVSRWSDGFLRALSLSNDPLVMVLMDDYWLLRKVDVEAIKEFALLMMEDRDILRFDLSSDRLYAEGAIDLYSISHYDVITTGHSVPYNISLQAGIWRRELLKQIVVPNESAWQLEMVGGERLKLHPEWKVLGSRQIPMKYLISVQGGKLELGGGYQSPHLDSLLRENQDYFATIKSLGYLEGL